MTEQSTFSYDRFMLLAGSDLVGYAEPYVNTKTQAIPESVYAPLQTALAGMDESHLVYALEICMLLKPHEFVNLAVKYLSYQDASVCCAAYNSIGKLPAASMSSELVTKIVAAPIVDLYGPDLRSDEKICVGTNEEFIRDLVVKFT